MQAFNNGNAQKRNIIKLTQHDKQSATLEGSAINSDSEPIRVYRQGTPEQCMRELSFYSEANGFECQRVIIKEVEAWTK